MLLFTNPILPFPNLLYTYIDNMSEAAWFFLELGQFELAPANSQQSHASQWEHCNIRNSWSVKRVANLGCTSGKEYITKPNTTGKCWNKPLALYGLFLNTSSLRLKGIWVIFRPNNVPSTTWILWGFACMAESFPCSRLCTSNSQILATEQNPSWIAVSFLQQRFP